MSFWCCSQRPGADSDNSAVIHAEMPVHAPGEPEPRGLKLWVDLPKQYKMVDPSYQELGPEGYVLQSHAS